MRSACLHAAGHVHWRWFAGTILEVASVSEFEKDLRKKKEGTDTLNQNQENSTKPAVPAEGENNAPAAPAKKRIAAVYRPQNSTQKRPAGNRQQGGQRPARQNNGSGMQVRPTTNSAPAEPAKAAETSAAPAPEKKAETVKTEAPAQDLRENVRPLPNQSRPEGRQGFQSRESRPFPGRDGNRESGRDNRQGGYQGNRDNNRQGGYQGNRDGNRQGGYQGNRDNNRQGGYQGRNDNRQGGNRSGMGIPKPSFDTPLAQKQQNTKQSKNAYKKEHDAKKDRDIEMKGKAGKGQKGVKAPVMPPQPKKEEAKVEEIKTIVIPEVITIKELADKMKLQPSAIVKKLFLQGTIVTINQEIDFEKAEEIAMEYDVLSEKEKKVNVIEELLKEDEEDEKDMVPRPPVICVMGHVDHGKTSLLDAIRQTNVTSREAGGITQHIGAYVVEYNGQKITFLDTPGHEAFTAMRMRGAQATDIAILVVAADDGVMPQTVEAINHAKAAGVEIIVAINKIDKPSANVERVKQELSEYELIPEDWGGSTVFVPVSAHTKEGIPELLEMILLTAEVKELKANPNRRARGLVIEAQLDKGRGPVATVLVQKGTLKVGDAIAAGCCYGKVRAMMDDKGNRVKEAGPSTPVEILGLNDVPNAGEVFIAHQNEKEARSFAETFIAESKNKLIEDTKAKLSLDDLFSQIKAGNVKELPIIVKADVQGSVAAVTQSHVKRSKEQIGDKRVRRYTCIRFQCDHYRFQRSSGRTGEVHRGPRESRHASVPRHLPGDRGCRGCHEGYAGSGIRGAGNRSCGCPPDIQGIRSRHHRRFLCA